MKKIYTIGLFLSGLFFLYANIQAQSQCPNLDFSMGNFTHWQAYSTTLGGIGYVSTVPVPGRQTIMDAAQLMITNQMQDEHCPAIPKVPNGFNYSAKLGNDNTWEIEALEYTMTIDSTNSLFILHFAWVMGNSGHEPAAQPKFTIEIRDSLNRRISNFPCGMVEFTEATDMDLACARPDLIARNWTTVGFNLDRFMGQRIKLYFETRDCMENEHFAYAYLIGECRPSKVDLQFCEEQTEAHLYAPDGFTWYRWTRSRNASWKYEGGGKNYQNIVISDPLDGEKFRCEATSELGAVCYTSFYTTIAKTFIDADFVYGITGGMIIFPPPHPFGNWYDTCNRTATFIDLSTVKNSKKKSILWEIPALNVFSTDSLFTYTFPNPKTNDPVDYLVRLTVYAENGCMDVSSERLEHHIMIYPSPEINIVSSKTFFTEGKDTLTAIFDGNFLSYQWSWILSDSTTGTDNTSNPLIVENMGTYWLKAQDNDGCLYAHSIRIADLKAFFKYGVMQADGGVDFVGHNNENWYDTCTRSVTFVDSSHLYNTTIRSRLWTIEGMDISSEDSLFTFIFPDLNMPKTYKISLTVEGETGCMDTCWQSITIHPSPEINIISSETFSTERKDILTAIFKGNISSYQWSWILNDNTTGNDNISNPFIAENTGTYWLKAQGYGGCLLVDSIRISNLKAFFKYGVMQAGSIDFVGHNNENWYDTCTRSVTFVDSSFLDYTTVRSRLWTIEGMNISSSNSLFTVSFPDEEQVQTYIVLLMIVTENDDYDVYKNSITIFPLPKIDIKLSRSLSDTLTAVSIWGKFVSYQWSWISHTRDTITITTTDKHIILTEPWINCFLRAEDKNGCYAYDTIYYHQTSIGEHAKQSWTLEQNIPNPAKTVVSIPYNIPEEGKISFEVYSFVGQLLHREELIAPRGENKIEYHVSNLSSGIYLYVIRYNDHPLSRKMIVRK
jgi:hypothetical protein